MKTAKSKKQAFGSAVLTSEPMLQYINFKPNCFICIDASIISMRLDLRPMPNGAPAKLVLGLQKPFKTWKRYIERLLFPIYLILFNLSLFLELFPLNLILFNCIIFLIIIKLTLFNFNLCFNYY